MKNQSRIWMIILSVLGCFAMLPVQAGLSPAPDGCYPNFTTAEGCSALNALTTGAGNTALGWRSLFATTDGSFNTGVGGGALALNNGSSNTAVGAAALLLNTTGNFNTAVGTDALVNNTTSFDNTAVGFEALSQTTGGANTAVGRGALDSNVSGNFNTAVGKDAGGAATGSGNVYIGHGIFGVAGENNHTYIRNIKDTSVSGMGSDLVTVDLATGLLGHASSSRRYKEDIRPMDKTSEEIYQLQPVTFRYKKEIDRTQSPAFGLIAEEVAKVNPSLIVRDSQGRPENVHYEMVNAMLLNEFLKEHQTVKELKGTVAQQKKQIDALIAGLQKVSAELEMAKPATKVVVNQP